MVNSSSSPRLQHRQAHVANQSIHVVEGGVPGRGSMLFLHGWPESWFAFEQVMLQLCDRMHVVAIDLPGIGESTGEVIANDKRSLALHIHELIQALDLRDVTLVGHDVGGQIVYAYLHAYPGDLKSAAILNVAIPGVEPWRTVVANPRLWHVGFHAVPGLPELLVTGHQAEYFSCVYEALAGPAGVSPRARKAYADAYSRPAALHTGFEWYRAFPTDAADNVEMQDHIVDLPVLYVRGAKEPGKIEQYLEGLRRGGLTDVRGAVIPGSGHFTPSEQPEALAEALLTFIAAGQPRRKRITAKA